MRPKSFAATASPTHIGAMPLPLLLLLPILAEIAVFVLVGQAIGVLATLALVLAATLAGVLILRSLGPKTLGKVRADLAARRVPARPIAEGAATAVAAFLLILPGFVSDILGILLLVPGVREGLWRWAAGRVRIVPLRETPAGRQPPLVDLSSEDYAPAPRMDSPWRDGDAPK